MEREYKTITMEKNRPSCNNPATERKSMDDWTGRENLEDATTKITGRFEKGSWRIEIVMKVEEKCMAGMT